MREPDPRGSISNVRSVAAETVPALEGDFRGGSERATRNPGSPLRPRRRARRRHARGNRGARPARPRPRSNAAAIPPGSALHTRRGSAELPTTCSSRSGSSAEALIRSARGLCASPPVVLDPRREPVRILCVEPPAEFDRGGSLGRTRFGEKGDQERGIEERIRPRLLLERRFDEVEVVGVPGSPKGDGAHLRSSRTSPATQARTPACGTTGPSRAFANRGTPRSTASRWLRASASALCDTCRRCLTDGSEPLEERPRFRAGTPRAHEPPLPARSRRRTAAVAACARPPARGASPSMLCASSSSASTRTTPALLREPTGEVPVPPVLVAKRRLPSGLRVKRRIERTFFRLFGLEDSCLGLGRCQQAIPRPFDLLGRDAPESGGERLSGFELKRHRPIRPPRRRPSTPGRRRCRRRRSRASRRGASSRRGA